jgi:hypothetical protein
MHASLAYHRIANLAMNAARLGFSLSQEPLTLASAPTVPGFFMLQAEKYSLPQHYGTTRYG